jgi:hypothetical protein
MDKAFIIEAFSAESGKPVIGVLFTNTPPAREGVQGLGFTDVSSVSEVKPLSRQPTEPTLYFFERQGGDRVRIVRLGWDGSKVSSAEAFGEPHKLIPAVSGTAAGRHLYAGRAYVITGFAKDGGRSTPVVGVLTVKPEPGGNTLQPDRKALRRMGISDIQCVDNAYPEQEVCGNTLYVFERTPAAASVLVSSLDSEGNITGSRTESGEPHSIIPPLRGAAAERFLRPRGSLAPGDMRAPSSVPPASARQKKRRL